MDFYIRGYCVFLIYFDKMASSHGNTHSEAAKMEQIITEFFAKSLHIILESRSPYMSSRTYSGEQMMSSPSSSSSSSSSVRPRDKWFNLALRESPAALENLDLWRQSNLEPILVDVILEQRPVDWDPLNFSPHKSLVRNLSAKERCPNLWNSDQEELGSEAKSEKIVERWIVQYESKKCRDSSSGSRRSSNTTLHAVYKKAILLLRSLYVTVRLFPAYKIFRDLNSSGHLHAFKLVPRVSSFAEPFTRKEEAEMTRFSFTPVDTPSGRLCLSVFYRSSILDISSEPSTPMSPQVITDYVGSPLADPLRRFPSLPVSHGSPSSLPFSRRHSWSYDSYKVSPPISFSPSPTHSESQGLVSNPNSHRLPPMSLPHIPPEASQAHKKNRNFDEYYPSPTFSPSPSPSPPIYIPGNHLSKALLRSESAPVNIPGPKLATLPALFNRQNMPPSPPLKVKKPGTVRTVVEIDKFSCGSENARINYGVKMPSNSSPQRSFSRSSTRSFQDDFDESEFPCPFDVDDYDIADPGNRQESGLNTETLGGLSPDRTSQDAAVGALVRMLKKAPPLRSPPPRQDSSCPITSPAGSRPGSWRNSIQEPGRIPGAMILQNATSTSTTSSSLIASKTTADALEEFRGYKEMRNLLLTQGGKSFTSPGHVSKAGSLGKG